MNIGLNLAKNPMTEFNIKDRYFESIRSMYRISVESAQPFVE